jgi:fructose-1,6-bisphosphatase/inositol monophosphatase family enzyme
MKAASFPSDKEIIKHCKPIVSLAIHTINIQIKDVIGLETVPTPYKDANNITRQVDKTVHTIYHTNLRKYFEYNIIIAGEETEKKRRRKTWSKKDKEEKIVASIDAVDGTDLVSKGLYNWCTAVFFFKPDSHIIASLVGVPSGAIYYASDEGAFMESIIEGEKKRRKLNVPYKKMAKNINDASICFYGQKAPNFLSIAKNHSFLKLLTGFQKEIDAGKDVPFRIYNFGGNPMMIKLIEGGVDAVIELRGQSLYDVVPGAFIAQRAGAFWGDLKGNEITKEYLREKFLSSTEPGELSYILTSSRQMYNQLLRCFRN